MSWTARKDESLARARPYSARGVRTLLYALKRRSPRNALAVRTAVNLAPIKFQNVKPKCR